MSPQYHVAKLCLQMLKGSEMPTRKKLRLEVQLIQLLRLLLSEDLACTVVGPCSKKAFDELLEEVTAIREKRGMPGDINSAMERLGGILLTLSERTGPVVSSSCAS